MIGLLRTVRKRRDKTLDRFMITVVKLNALGQVKITYAGVVIEQLADGVVIQAYWTLAARDLGYTRFEPGDRFIEYYYTKRWYNIFDIASADGTRKGWYCNVAEPATIYDDHIEQVDLLLDVWVDATGKPLILDEDEFASDMTLSEEQRNGAQEGLRDLLEMIAARQEPFS
jgi:protein associated with RNAse G/E